MVTVAVLRPYGPQRDVRRIEKDARARDENFAELFFLGRRESILAFRGAPSDEKFLGIAAETCLRGQLDSTTLGDIFH